MALNLAYLAEATGETTLHGAAVRAAEMVASRLGSIGSVADVSGSEHPYAGLMQGSTGPALLFVRLYETTGDTAWLDHAALALRQDLRRCVTRDDDGAMHVNEGSRTLPYLATGSVGIGLVLDRYLTHRPDEQFASASAAIHTAARSWFSAQSGLFSGRAGMVYYLAQRARAGHPTAHADLADQIRHLSWHAIAFGDGGLAFAGDQLIRLSMDLATGTAGVLLALGAALPDSPVHLPFLEPRDQPTPSARGGEKHATPGPSGPAYRAG
jgi:hypothetical protein